MTTLDYNPTIEGIDFDFNDDDWMHIRGVVTATGKRLSPFCGSLLTGRHAGHNGIWPNNTPMKEIVAQGHCSCGAPICPDCLYIWKEKHHGKE